MKAALIKRFDTEIAVLEKELTQDLPKDIQRARELSSGNPRESAALWQTIAGREPVVASLAKRESVAALLASSNGSLRVNVSGGRISNLLDAKLAPNPLAVFGAWLSSKTDVAVHFAAAALDVSGGVGKVRTIALDTDRARVEGTGRIDLGEERGRPEKGRGEHERAGIPFPAPGGR